MKNLLLYLSIGFNIVFIVTLLIFIKNKGGFSSIENKFNNDFSNTYYLRNDIIKSIPQIDNSIVFFGDSHIALCEWHEFFPTKMVSNRGINSDDTEGLILRLRETKNLNPSKIFYLIGVNDLRKNKSPEDIVDNIQKIYQISKKKYPNALIYFISILPTNNIARDNVDIFEINHLVKEKASLFDFNFVDVYNIFLSSDKKNIRSDLTYDGLHLNSRGYQVLVKELENYIN